MTISTFLKLQANIGPVYKYLQTHPAGEILNWQMFSDDKHAIITRISERSGILRYTKYTNIIIFITSIFIEQLAPDHLQIKIKTMVWSNSDSIGGQNNKRLAKTHNKLIENYREYFGDVITEISQRADDQEIEVLYRL